METSVREVLNLYIIAFCCMTIWNMVVMGWHTYEKIDYESVELIYDEQELYGPHYDLEITTYCDTYYVNMQKNRVFSRSGNVDKMFRTPIDMNAWIANKTKEDADFALREMCGFINTNIKL